MQQEIIWLGRWWCETLERRCCWRVTVKFPPSLLAMITFYYYWLGPSRCQLDSHSLLTPDDSHSSPAGHHLEAPDKAMNTSCVSSMFKPHVICSREKGYLKQKSWIVIDCDEIAGAIWAASGVRGCNERAMSVAWNGDLWSNCQTIPCFTSFTNENFWPLYLYVWSKNVWFDDYWKPEILAAWPEVWHEYN